MKGRFRLLGRLAKAMEDHPEFFGYEVRRPGACLELGALFAVVEVARSGNIVDYVLQNCGADKTVSFRVLWQAIIVGLERYPCGWAACLSLQLFCVCVQYLAEHTLRHSSW